MFTVHKEQKLNIVWNCFKGYLKIFIILHKKIKTEKTISDSAEYSEENTKIIGDIVGFVETQKDSAEEISGYLNSISDMVENNAASAEENSAISANLGVCARSLMDMIAQFKLHRK